MNKEEYLKLRLLEENRELTDKEFFNKYKNELDNNFIYRQSNIIKDSSDFIDNMVDMKNSIEKKVIIYEKNKY